MAKGTSKKETDARGARAKNVSGGRKQSGRTFQSIDEVRRTYYPDAFGRMKKQRRQSGLERFDHGDAGDD